MSPRIRPLRFLLLLVVGLVVTYQAWKPLAPAYAQVLLRATRVGLWLTEFSTDPNWSHPTALFIDTQRNPTGIFYLQTKLGLATQPPADQPLLDWLKANPSALRMAPQGIPAEWVMANLVLLIPLMLATPAPTWGVKAKRLGLALAIALVLQVFDVVVSIKASYATAFPGAFNPFMTRVYQFFDAFVQSWDTQLFPFVIWAGIHFRQILPQRLLTPATGEAQRAPAAPDGLSRAERRRQIRR
ncbi:MAG: hypothetical protein SF182_02635 [Deltaproteobacteria bacterium]|nr:hypothetical protein [Deltaproteobacteria bacterium]